MGEDEEESNTPGVQRILEAQRAEGEFRKEPPFVGALSFSCLSILPILSCQVSSFNG